MSENTNTTTTTETTQPENSNIFARIERVKEAVQETADGYQGMLYGSMPISEVLSGISELCDVLLTGGDLEAFLVSKQLARPQYDAQD